VKTTFKNIFLVLTVILVILPFLTTFSEQLTGLIQKTPLYLFIQEYIVPFEVRIVGLILSLLQIPTGIGTNSLTVAGQPLQVTWNCLGWQSVLFLLVSFFTGLQGQFKLTSKLEAVAIGILGTFWINILRIVFISILGGYFPSIFAIVFHDYFATLVTVAWLFAFWYFAYNFVLEIKEQGS
jgi:exosortase/archaeosortase family protein